MYRHHRLYHAVRCDAVANKKCKGRKPGSTSAFLIQTWLGHSSPTTTALYTHLTPRTEARATEVLNQLLEGVV